MSMSELDLKQILSAIGATDDLVRESLRERSRYVETISKLEVKMDNMEENVHELLHIVRGNGQEGLQMRVRMLEQRAASVDQKFSAIGKSKGEVRKGRLILWGALISGTLAFATAIATVLIS